MKVPISILSSLICISIFSRAEFAVVNIPSDDTLNVRVEPNINAQKIGELLHNAKNIEILTCQQTSTGSSWCKIRHQSKSSTLEGWVSENYIMPDNMQLDILNKSLTSFKINTLKKVDKNRFKTEGKILTALQYQDKLGKNSIIYTQQLLHYNEISYEKLSTKASKIRVYHFTEQDQKMTKLRVIQDTETCGTDESFGLYISKNSLSVTDLNQDGIAEVTFVYDHECLNDYVPATIKLMMLSNGQKYPIRGTVLRPDLDEASKKLALTHIDPAFETAPPSFLTFAKKKME